MAKVICVDFKEKKIIPFVKIPIKKEEQNGLVISGENLSVDDYITLREIEWLFRDR